MWRCTLCFRLGMGPDIGLPLSVICVNHKQKDLRKFFQILVSSLFFYSNFDCQIQMRARVIPEFLLCSGLRTLVLDDKVYATCRQITADDAEPRLNESRLIGTVMYCHRVQSTTRTLVKWCSHGVAFRLTWISFLHFQPVRAAPEFLKWLYTSSV
jgi:hypothetical protein